MSAGSSASRRPCSRASRCATCSTRRRTCVPWATSTCWCRRTSSEGRCCPAGVGVRARAVSGHPGPSPWRALAPRAPPNARRAAPGALPLQRAGARGGDLRRGASARAAERRRSRVADLPPEPRDPARLHRLGVVRRHDEVALPSELPAVPVRRGPAAAQARGDARLGTPAARHRQPVVQASLYALLTYTTRFGVPPAPAEVLRRLADNGGLVGPIQRRLIHVALDGCLVGARAWSLPFPPPMPGRYSPRHQLRKRLGRG